MLFHLVGGTRSTMNAPHRRVNTFRIEFANLSKKPSFENIHRFIAEALGLSKTQVVRVQINHYLWCAFVKCVDLETAQSIVQQHDNRHEIEVSGKKIKLRILMEDGAVDVRLHDLSEDVTNEAIVEHMSNYGQVLAIEELAWSEKYAFDDIPSGIRSVKMILKSQIKSYITVEGETTYVTYFGQKHTCRHCNEYIHSGIPCTQNKKLLVQKVSVNDRINTTKQSSNTSSYANAVKRDTGPTFVLPSTSSPPAAVTSLPSLQPENSELNTAMEPPATHMECNSKDMVMYTNTEMPQGPAAIIATVQQVAARVVTADDSFKTPLVPNPKTNTDIDDGVHSDGSTASSSSTNRSLRPKKYKYEYPTLKKPNQDRRTFKP